MHDRVIHSPNELLKRLLGTAAHIQIIAQSRELENMGKVRSILEGLRQQMSQDIEAIDAYLQKLQ